MKAKKETGKRRKAKRIRKKTDKKNKIYFLGIFLVTLAVAAAHSDEFPRFLLGFELLLCLFLFVTVQVMRRRVAVHLRLPEVYVKKKGDIRIEAELDNTGWIPVPEIRVELGYRDLYDQKSGRLSGTAMLDGKGKVSLCFHLTSEYCGAAVFWIERVTVSDYLGVFGAACKKPETQPELSVLPLRDRELSAIPEQARMLSGEENAYALNISGDDPSEIHDIREFRQGDTLNRIHWKMTAKTGEMLVRDLGSPLENTALVLYDLKKEKEHISRREWDYFLETAASLSDRMLRAGNAHIAAWMDRKSGEIVRMHVGGEEELQSMLSALLRANVYDSGEIEALYRENYADETLGEIIRVDLAGHIAAAPCPQDGALQDSALRDGGGPDCDEKSSPEKKKEEHRSGENDMGLRITGRELIPRNAAAARPFFWFLTAWGQLLLLAGGFCGALVTGFSLPAKVGLLYPGLLLLCLAAALFFFGERLNGYRIYGGMAGILCYAVLLFFTQEQFLSGARQMGNAVLACMNSRYGSNFFMSAVGNDSSALTVFLLEIFAAAVFWMAAAAVYRPDIVWIALLLFPSMTILFLTGGSPSALSLFFLLFGILSVLASSRSVRKKRLWGERKTARYQNNLICHNNIQKKTALLVCGAGLVLAVFGFCIVRPGLSLQLTKAETITEKAEGKLMTAMIRILPGISAGNLKLRVETAGGGVSDGSLGEADGYILEGIEDLKITSSSKPEETIYLKGYVGSGYDGDRWLAAQEDSFLNAAVNWKTEGDPRLYIQNLPFLRALYIENEAAGETSHMQQLTIERLNANSNYTYYPYCAYLNEYYQVQSGDGCVTGQSEQDDIFSYYPRSYYREAVEGWNLDADKSSVLDRVEASYAAYAASVYLDVPEGFEQLRQQCEQQKINDGDVDGICEYIRGFLSDGYTFSLNAPGLPEGEDFVRYFLYESKTGCSTHYASAAVLMFRMFGIPARYVVGYAAPQNLFTAQPDGTYTAVLQDDNSHAWAEIYVDGTGWIPAEMTPGALGTTEEVEAQGDLAVNQGTPGEEQENGASQNENQTAETEKDKIFRPKWLDGGLESVIRILAAILLCAGVLTGAVSFVRKRRKTLGLNRRLAPERRIQNIFQAYYHSLVKKGMSPEVESSSAEFAEYVKKWNSSLTAEEFCRMMELVSESCYGFREKQEADVKFMRGLYKRLRKDLIYRKNK